MAMKMPELVKGVGGRKGSAQGKCISYNVGFTFGDSHDDGVIEQRVFKSHIDFKSRLRCAYKQSQSFLS